MQRSIPITIFLVLSAAASPARGGGFLTAHYAGEQGHVATDNPTAIYFNPAGLALGVGWRIYAEGLLAWRRRFRERFDFLPRLARVSSVWEESCLTASRAASRGDLRSTFTT